MSTSENSVVAPSWIPEGYLFIKGPGNLQYVAPEFSVPALVRGLEAFCKKNEIDVDGAAGAVSILFLSLRVRPNHQWFIIIPATILTPFSLRIIKISPQISKQSEKGK